MIWKKIYLNCQLHMIDLHSKKGYKITDIEQNTTKNKIYKKQQLIYAIKQIQLKINKNKIKRERNKATSRNNKKDKNKFRKIILQIKAICICIPHDIWLMYILSRWKFDQLLNLEHALSCKNGEFICQINFSITNIEKMIELIESG